MRVARADAFRDGRSAEVVKPVLGVDVVRIVANANDPLTFGAEKAFNGGLLEENAEDEDDEEKADGCSDEECSDHGRTGKTIRSELVDQRPVHFRRSR
jgi:hypothetical protein